MLNSAANRTQIDQKLAQPGDRLYRLAFSAASSFPQTKRDVPPPLVTDERDKALIEAFNKDVAAFSGRALEELPVMPVSSVFAGPFYFRFALLPEHHGLTLGCHDLTALVKGVARNMGLSNNYTPHMSRSSREALCPN